MTREVINELKKYTLGRKNTEKVEINVLQLNRIIKALEQEPCGDWYDVSSNEMTLEQARQAVKDLRKKLAEYLEQEPCEDAISRSDMLDAIGHGTTYTSEELQEIIKGMPPVNPQEPKTGHWIISPNDCFATCSECGLHGDKGIYKHYGWCPSCGAKMVEPQEIETWNGIHAQITAPKGTFERIFNDADDDSDI